MIIGICGYKGAGKDTVGSVLVEDHKYEQISFASPIKDMVADDFNIDRDILEGSDCKLRTLRDDPKFGAYGKSGRELLQIVGCMYRDNINPDIWCDKLIADCHEGVNYVVTDVRFPNEIKAIEAKGGLIVAVKRHGHHGDDHQSERALDNHIFRYVINNYGTIEDLKVEARRFFKGKV